VSRRATREPVVRAAGPSGLPRLLAPPCADHAEHLARYGPLPAIRSRSERADLVATVEASGLCGRGGGAFPTARKLRAVADGGRGPVIVANGAEGEPASQKDSVLMQRTPHLVVDGALVAARAVGAEAIHFVVDRADLRARAAMTRAVLARSDERSRPGAWEVIQLPSRYVAGEESALVNFVNGNEARPVTVPPRPYERGVRGRPTLVQNVETLANLALIARYGADWYGSVGTTDEPGSVLTTVLGAVERPGVYEFACGSRYETVLSAAGGSLDASAALLVGGYFGSWCSPAEAAALALAHGVMRRAGRVLGCGVVVALPVDACGVAETARVARYLASESAGQCGPCVHGLAAVAHALEDVTAGRARPGTLARIDRWLGDIEGRGACHLPDAVVGFVRSARRVFADDFASHELHGPCPHARHMPVLPLPDPVTRDRSFR
jgi:NADH:ubiquinone oxidoreductase subunit F (NADH-binding)